MNKSFIIRNKNVIGMDVQRVYTSTPVGIIQPFASNTNIPRGYLLCDGTSYKVADYPDLYAVIGNTYGGDTENFNVPDYRETVLVGVGENTTDTIASHDVYELGEFKDDQLQRITGDFEAGNRNTQPHTSGAFSAKGSQYTWFALSETATTSSRIEFDSSTMTRSGTTTHGKQKVVTYIIKAFHTNEGVDSKNEVSDPIIEYVEGEIAKVDTELNAKLDGLSTYSTEETICGTWIDGKPIYRKVITYTLSNALTGLVEIAHNIQNIETPIRIVFGKATVPGSSNSITIPSQYDSTTFIQLGAFSDTYVQLFTGSTNWTSLKEITLCLEYTKTTDA